MIRLIRTASAAAGVGPDRDPFARAAEEVDLLAGASRPTCRAASIIRNSCCSATAMRPRCRARRCSTPSSPDRHGKIAVSFVEWSGYGAQKLVIDWTVIDGTASRAQLRRPDRRGAALVRRPHLDQPAASTSRSRSWSARRSRRRAAPSTCRATAPTMPAATCGSPATRRSPRASPSTAS